MDSDWFDGYLIVSMAVVLLIACWDGREKMEPGAVVFFVMLWPLGLGWLIWRWIRG
jgi:hypothetical protein